ncbi:MAG: LacI family DNA-binding transcriptional regulator [Mycetocola sp.]
MSKPATIRDVALFAQVSVGTVSNYLNNTKPIGAATRLKIEDAIERLDFVPNSAVRIVLGGRAPVIAFLVPDAANPFFAEVARGIEDIAVKQGQVVVICNTEGDAEREKHYARALSEMRVHAVLAVASSTTSRTLSTLRRTGAHVVTLGDMHDSMDISSVTLDDERGGYLAMAHLLELGHRSVAFFGGAGATPQIADRIAGCWHALHDSGVPRSALHRFDAPSSRPSDRLAVAAEILDHSPSITGVVCGNDLLAMAVETVALRRGLPIPGGVAIVGFDDIENALNAPVPLTTIRQPQYELGRTAALLANNDRSVDHVTFDPTLIVRASTTGH